MEIKYLYMFASALAVCLIQFQLHQRRKREDDVGSQLQEYRDDIIKIKSKMVEEARVREIAVEVMKPLKEGQDDIKHDVKQLLKEFHNLAISLAETHRRS